MPDVYCGAAQMRKGFAKTAQLVLQHFMESRVLSPTTSSDGHTRSTDCTTLTMAEWMCGEADRIDPAGLP